MRMSRRPVEEQRALSGQGSQSLRATRATRSPFAAGRCARGL
jgi:hypothetical protein